MSRSLKNPVFLLYYTHSGFSNQLFGLKKAAQLAYASKRVLVLPPVLPHTGEKGVRKFPQWHARSAGSGCKPHQQYPHFEDTVLQDAAKARFSRIPSLKEIIDFSVLTAETGLKVKDMSDWSMHTHHHNLTNKWCSGHKQCKMGLSESYQKMVQVFNQSHGNGTCSVALIGSGFNMGHDFSDYDKNASHLFDNFFFGFPFNPNFLFLLEKVYQKLPSTGFVGVHIRLKDKPSFPCGDKNGTLFKRVADRIVVGEPNATSGGGGKMTVLIGRSN
jgi:hypothetical protein